MPPNSSEAGVGAVLRPHADRVVPAVFLFDASPFAQAARRWYEAVHEERLEKILRTGTIADVWAAVGQLFAGGFPQSVAPLTLVEHVPAWCVWFAGVETTTPELLYAQLEQVESEQPGQFHHLLFIRVQTLDEVSRWLPQVKTATVVPFFVANEGGIQRSDTDLAEGAVAYAYASWKRYWENGEANLRGALTLPTDSRVLTLGMGTSVLDVAYHAQRWSRQAAEQVRADWLERTVTPERPKLRSLKELLRFLLPAWYLTAEKTAQLRGLDVKMIGESVRLYYAGRKLHVGMNPLIHRRHFQRFLVQLKDKFCFLAFITLPNTKRFIELHATRLANELWDPVREYLKLPAESRSLLSVLRQKLQFCIEHSHTLQEIIVAAVPTSSFPQDYKSAWKRISAIPNPLGALARLVLITIGLTWLVVGPLFGASFTNPLGDPLLRRVAGGAAILLVVSFVGVLVHYYWSCFRALREIDTTEINIELRHLGATGGLAVEKIRTEGAALMHRLQDLQERLDKLTGELAQPLNVTAQATKAANAMFISDAGVDVLVRPHLGELAAEAYTRFLSELSQSHQQDGVISLEDALWRELILKHAAAVCSEFIGKLTFDECVEAMGPSDMQMQTLLNNLVSEAHKPALKGVPADSEAPTLCFAKTEQWKAFCGQNDTLQFYNLNLRDMLIVSITPIRKFAQP